MKLRVATYNLHGCKGRDGVRAPARCAEVIAEMDADIIALQEVWFNHTAHVDDARYLLEHLPPGYVARCGPTFQRHRRYYGNVLLTRHVPHAVARESLMVGREPRGVIDARIDVAKQRVRVLATHLSPFRLERRAQAAALADLVGGPAINGHTLVLGDLNEWLRDGWTLQPLFALGFRGVPRAATFPSRLPFLALDRILTHGMEVRDWRVHRSRMACVASDHLPLVADLALAGGAPDEA